MNHPTLSIFQLFLLNFFMDDQAGVDTETQPTQEGSCSASCLASNAPKECPKAMYGPQPSIVLRIAAMWLAASNEGACHGDFPKPKRSSAMVSKPSATKAAPTQQMSCAIRGSGVAKRFWAEAVQVEGYAIPDIS
eukprot:CAMPEP_0178442350 /NCGR_PEP_ID=MMETSP0689_2-20121128/38096_1 /TAXON_ID=160604 /ORGANISM="Amphidinium massartii, Strain CS-259" /LENGTH=134 /DNA_ID=CAMNT_0020065847 /DNA_START=974 /DNA_END=1379 /DNA_ORIENTATION=+